jgi:hypothetical protein
MVIGAAVAGFIIGVLIALLGGSVRRMKVDPETGAKLSSLKSALTFKQAAATHVDASGDSSWTP